MIWNDDNTITIDATSKNSKKITGTTFAMALDQNPYGTPFQVFVRATHIWEKPYQSTEYTILGKVIEDRQCKFLSKYYFVDVIKPEDIYGDNFFKITHGDFFPDNKMFGGMWDGVIKKDGKYTAIVECKTTQRAEDWVNDKGEVQVPIYYALQGSLYAYLLGVDDVYIVVSFPREEDYARIRNLISTYGINFVDGLVDNGKIKEEVKFKCDETNTRVIHFKVSEQYPNFSELVDQVEHWYNDHIKKGISPTYDEEKDKEILSDLRRKNVNPTTDLTELLVRYETLDRQLNVGEDIYDQMERELDNLKGQIKQILGKDLNEENQIREVCASTTTSDFTVRKVFTERFDTTKFREDYPELYKQYIAKSERIMLSRKERK